MRSDPSLQDTAFVLISGETVREKVMEAVKAGVDGYIVKPYSLSVLGVGIHEALKRRKTGQDNDK
jgi:two-component system chemotaxis response regulator CheY